MSSRGYVPRGFVSSPALAADAIQQALLERALAERQAEMDAQKQREAEASIRQRDEQLALTRRAQDIADAQRTDALNSQNEEREFRRASTVADTMIPGIVDQSTGDLLQKHGYGGLVQRVDVPGTPGVMDTAGGFKWQQARQQEQARAEQAAAAQAAAAERQQQHDETIRAMRSGQQPQSEPLEAVMGPDGSPVLMPRSQAAGKRPASTREQGRPVGSSDANRIAELDTALNELTTIEPDVKKTGAASSIGAALPNVVTQFTGLGAKSKATQATIDRVKQIIGKALEGGVLRKEDEAKYARILPVIGDAPEVSKSKLQGLRQAIEQKRQTLIEALGDAGYDASKFAARGKVSIKSITPIP